MEIFAFFIHIAVGAGLGAGAILILAIIFDFGAIATYDMRERWRQRTELSERAKRERRERSYAETKSPTTLAY